MADKKKDKEKAIKEGNADKDSLDTLPLWSIPLDSNALKDAKLIKNSRLETSIELYSDPLTGSLQITPETVSDFMQASQHDQDLISSLARLNSFDVYSLRSSLKKLGVEIKSPEALELSDEMKERLSSESMEFVRPLIGKIFGENRPDFSSQDGLNKIFRDTDITRARENLLTISQKTGIALADIPKFIEEYNGVFLSVSYYRHNFAAVEQHVSRFLLWIHELKTHREVTSSQKTLAQCEQAAEIVQFLSTSLRERLLQFQTHFEMFWKDINSASFKHLARQIESNHNDMGAVLCGFIVKMNAWNKEFPNNTTGGPSTRVKYLMAEISPGMTRLRDLEIIARQKSGLPMKIIH